VSPRLHAGRELAGLAAQPLAASRVVELVDDPATSAGDLAAVIETDPALASRLLRLANAPQHGASRRIASIRQAVVLLGFASVRALAASAALGLLDEQHSTPVGFWPHAVSAAAASAAVADAVGVAPSSAFTAGLLHDVGTVILHRRDPDGYATCERAAGRGTNALLTAELRTFGATHPQLAADALDRWSFPRPLVEAVAAHHGGVGQSDSALARVLRLGEALAREVVPTTGHPDDVALERLEADLHLPPGRRPDLLDRIARELDRLLAPLTPPGPHGDDPAGGAAS
jgi:putative nucleotidyltransferase with HDIG domain